MLLSTMIYFTFILLLLITHLKTIHFIIHYDFIFNLFNYLLYYFIIIKNIMIYSVGNYKIIDSIVNIFETNSIILFPLEISSCP